MATTRLNDLKRKYVDNVNKLSSEERKNKLEAIRNRINANEKVIEKPSFFQNLKNLFKKKDVTSSK
jgi:hypothetical protein